MIKMTINGTNGVFLTEDEYSQHKTDIAIQRGQIWRRKMTDGTEGHYIHIIAVDTEAQVAVDRICQDVSDPTPKYLNTYGSGAQVGYARTFKDIRVKYDYVGMAPSGE